METWVGAAGICVNEKNQLLMVLQGKPDEKKVWSIPSGGKEEHESFEDCCKREIKEETGYKVQIKELVYIKEGRSLGISVQVDYFEVEIVGGKQCIQDPDGLIYEIAWKTADDITKLELSFEEDREFLINYLKQCRGKR